MVQDNLNCRKGHYLGTVIDEKWWKRYKKDKFFARGNGEYWFDDTTFYFRRYLTKNPIKIPLSKVAEIRLGKSHAGRWLLGTPVVKFIWEKDGLQLSSGFLVSRDKHEVESLLSDLKQRIS